MPNRQKSLFWNRHTNKCFKNGKGKNCIKSELVVASGVSLPFRDESFVLVSIWEAIEYTLVGTETRAVNEPRRILTPGGILLLSARNYYVNIQKYFNHKAERQLDSKENGIAEIFIAAEKVN